MNFDDLAPEEMEVVEKSGSFANARAGTSIVEEGQAGTSFFLLLSGTAEVRKIIRNSEFRKLEELGPCGVFGEFTFLGVEKRSAHVVAITDCTMLEFQRDAFTALMNKNPQIGLKFYRALAFDLARRLANSDDVLKDLILSGPTAPGSTSRLTFKNRP